MKYQNSYQAIYSKKTPVDTLKKRSNESLTDTKGFIPLPVQIKRYLLAGVRLKTMREQYTCEDYLEAYKDIECITEDMDITEIQEAVLHVNSVLEERRLARLEAEAVSTNSAPAAQNTPEGAEAVESVVEGVTNGENEN